MVVAERQDRTELAIQWRREMDGLQASTLSRYLWASVGLMGCWLVWITSPAAPTLVLGWGILLALGVCTLVAARLQPRHYLLSSVFLICGLLLSQSLVTASRAEMLYLGSGLVTLVVGIALLGTIGGLLVGAVSFASSVLLWQSLHGPAGFSSVVLPLGLLYLLLWASVVISRHPFAEALHLALSGWTRLQSALDETRDRRGELRRTIRALEEATYRIERMNNELLLARHQAELARVNKGRFAATVSHELRGPLNLVLGFSKLMALSPERYGAPLPRAYHADVDTIYTSSQHVVSLLDDILDLAQIEAENMPLVKERIDLNDDVVREAARTVSPLAERKGLRFEMELAEGLPQVLADRVRLRQVLLNLLTNAIRFTERGCIRISTAHTGQGLQVSVADTGRGIAKAKMPRLFEEFYQLHLTEQQGLQGSGLGLAISKHLVELHGGRIWAESVEGQGTTFHFALPLPEEALAVKRDVGRRTLRQPEFYRTVLVVHDDPLVLRVLARHLAGYRVIGLPRDDDVVAVVTGTHPRAVITTMNHVGAVRRAIANTPYDVPVLGCSMPDAKRGPQIEGAVAYLMKPITQEIVHATLNRFRADGVEPTVLIVDDEPDAARLLESLLDTGLNPCRVLRAHGGRQALQVMREEAPSVVFMDLVMPGLTGEETIREMRADPELATIPVVIVSGHDLTTQDLTLGADISVSSARPVSAADGIKRLQALLDVLSPDYLPGPTASEPTGEAAPA